MKIRVITISDYDRLINFWKLNYLLTPLDEFKRFKLFLQKNKNLSLVAEVGNEIVGTVLVSFNGRRGSFEKVVVDKNLRGKGIGLNLVKEVVKGLEELECLDIRFNVDYDLVTFYEKCGFKKDIRPTMILKRF